MLNYTYTQRLQKKFPGAEFIKVPNHQQKYVIYKFNGVKHKSLLSNLLRQKYINREEANKVVNKAKTTSFKEYNSKVKELNGDLLKVIKSSYTSIKQPVKYRCLKCNSINETRAGALLNKRKFGCKSCFSSANFAKSFRSLINVKFSSITFQFISKNEYIAFLLLTTKYKITDIADHSSGAMPIIKYYSKNKNHTYNPDFYIASRSLLIEVKDFNRLLLRRSTREWELLKLKAQACTDAGYKFKLMLMYKGLYELRVPNNWRDLPRNELRLIVKNKFVHRC